MKKIRGFRLGCKLARVWRWRQPKYRAFHRLSPTIPPSPSQSPHGYHHHNKPTAAMTTKIADWGRCLTRRLCAASRVCIGRTSRERETVGTEHYRRRRRVEGGENAPRDRLLPSEDEEKEHHRRQQQEEAEAWSKPPPKGQLAVYVGKKDVGPPHRVLVPVIYFNHPLFGELLREAEEEFGYHHPGGITIPCPISDFESVRTRVAATAGISRGHSRRSAGSRRWLLP